MNAKASIFYKKGYLKNPFFIYKYLMPSLKQCDFKLSIIGKMRGLILAFLIVIFFIFCTEAAEAGYGYSQVSQFLCEIGITFYKQGRYEEALHEFRKALIVEGDYEPALKYIQMIEQMQRKVIKEETIAPSAFKPAPPTFAQGVKVDLELFQIQREMIKERQAAVPRVLTPLLGAEKITLPRIINIDVSLSQIQQPTEIEQGKSIILLGKNIQRFLVTQPNILLVEKKSKDELLITGKDIGYTYLYAWDDFGRWTIEFLCILPKPTGPTLEEEMRLEEERENSFKIRYALDWHSFEQGRRLDSLDRQNYSWFHNLNLTGVTPYGNLDSTAIGRTLEAKSVKRSTDLTYFTMGLTEGKLGPFEDFTLRGFDLYPGFANMASGGLSTLRGAMIESPAFNKTIDYTVFWGREGTGKFGGLSPGLQKIRRAYLEGVDFNYEPNEDSGYGVSLLHGYGRDRPSRLNDYAYDARTRFNIGNWGYRYEIAHDTEKLAHLFSGDYTVPKLKFIYELRNIDKNFLNIMGETWRRGELGGLFTLNYAPDENWNIFNRLDVYQDRLFPSLESDNRWNQDYDFNARYTIDPTASLRLNYTLQNDLGKISESRYQSANLGFNKSFNLIRTISSFLDYRHQERKNFTNRSSDYINENISAGIRFSLSGQLYFFLNQQWNWLTERFGGTHSQPRALETGLDLSGQISKSPFYENLRFIYRNEEDANSPLSFLAGEDYIEGYAELSYRPTTGTEAYCSSRIRNIWADNPSVNKRIEADFNIGMRYLWDTGIRWESVGNIEGYVFRDLNSDGLREKDEAPVEGIKIWLGKKKSTTTDLFGYYKFSKVKGHKAYVILDTQSLPGGYVLTVPQRQEIAITQTKTGRVDFGIISRSEISGIVFYDINDDGEYNPQDTAIKNVTLTLENGVKVTTGSDGKYFIRNALTGEHEITLDLNSLPPDYLPKVPIIKKITLFEGVIYVYNIPLKKIEK